MEGVEEDMDTSTVPSKIKAPPIIVDSKYSFTMVLKTVGTNYKRECLEKQL